MIKKIYKEDYKHYRQCGKLTYLLRKENHKLTLEWQNKELSYLFTLPENDFSTSNDSSIKTFNENDLKNINYEDYILEDEEIITSEQVLDGLEVGYHAKQFFLRNFKCFDFDIYEKFLVGKKTTEKLPQLEYDVFFEPRFEYNDCVTKVDILKRNGFGWDLIEVKATSSANKEHLYDVLYQYNILINCGLEIKNVYLMHLNSKYYYKDELDYDRLFILSSQYNLNSSKIKKQKLLMGIKKELELFNIEKDLDTIKKILQQDPKEMLKLLKSDSCLNNNAESYCYHVFNSFPLKDTIFNLYLLRKNRKALLYYENNLLYLNDSNILDFKFTTNQIRQIKVVQNLEDVVSYHYKYYLQKVYSEYNYPIYFYDFETMKSAIPKYDFSIPYEQIPFQYSIHIVLDSNKLESPEKIINFSYLADGENDHRYELLKNLINDLTKFGVGTYVAYNKSFEIGVLKRLANLFPEYCEILKQIREKTVDLMDFFKNFAIYKKEFNGSLSIKKTLPAFNAEFSYDDLQVQKGTEASILFRKRRYNKLISFKDNNFFYLKLSNDWQTINLEQWQKEIVKNLELYCQRDTYGMVILFIAILKLLKEKEWI